MILKALASPGGNPAAFCPSDPGGAAALCELWWSHTLRGLQSAALQQAVSTPTETHGVEVRDDDHML